MTHEWRFYSVLLWQTEQGGNICLAVLDPHVGHEVPVAHAPVVAQVAPDGVRQALVNLQPMLTPVSCSLVRVRLILR